MFASEMGQSFEYEIAYCCWWTWLENWQKTNGKARNPKILHKGFQFPSEWTTREIRHHCAVIWGLWPSIYTSRFSFIYPNWQSQVDLQLKKLDNLNEYTVPAVIMEFNNNQQYGGSYLLDLSYDIMRVILSFLSSRDILQLSETCLFFNDICNEDSLWKELFMKEFPHSFSIAWRPLRPLNPSLFANAEEEQLVIS